MGTTSDRNDPRLTRGSDSEPVQQAEVYLVLSEEERAKGFVRPLRRSYFHETCGTITSMNNAIAATYATSPSFYGSTYCSHCCMHKPVGANGQFLWVQDGVVTNIKVGT